MISLHKYLSMSALTSATEKYAYPTIVLTAVGIIYVPLIELKKEILYYTEIKSYIILHVNYPTI